MSHRRLTPADRAVPWCFRAARAGVIPAAMLGVPAAVVALCVVGEPAR
ncbi:hypothetical protein [Streptomyces coffeae]|uniref:Uncharacterized protein n=1 Tax=Streptomyces coffeae TaxID=621382 RepID=A0ABS1NEK3_9ACTN|nr:hypothetical protein [Streptomyces coffeae]MBL1098409.1 hypothetical protein [Streptomyces coffeae]